MSAAAVGQSSTAARILAGLIALSAIAGILLFLQAEIEKSGSFWQSVVVLSRFFTILSNVLVALVFGLLAFGVQVQPRFVAGTVLAIVLVGVVYELLLKGLVDLTAGSAVANVLLHRVTPILAPLFWALFTPKGTLRYADPMLWAAFPFAYLGYALIRGMVEGKYAYPFIDVAALGAAQVAINVGVIGAGFFAVGAALVWLDSRLGQR